MTAGLGGVRRRWRESRRRKHAKVCPPRPNVARFGDEYLCRHGLWVFRPGGVGGGGRWAWLPDLHGEWSPQHEGFTSRYSPSVAAVPVHQQED